MRRIIETYKYFSDRRYSTIAGTLVYFFLMSIAPFLVWLTLILGNVDLERFFSHRVFESIYPIIAYLQASAGNAARGAGIILLVTSLYSSTNFFYHLRRSGEIVYDSDRVKGGIRLRIASLVLILCVLLLIAVLTAVGVTGAWVLEVMLPEWLAAIISSLFLTAVAFLVALVLNIFACPYKLKAFEALSGTCLTCALWIVLTLGFSVYTSYADPAQLYGAIAFIIIFLLWCYIMMCSFVIGMILNGSLKKRRVYKKLL